MAVLLGAAVAVSGAAPAAADPSTVREAEWFLDALKIPDAQKITTGAGVVVAVVDTPIDSTVPDLAGQLLPGFSVVASAPGGVGRGAATTHGTNMAALIAGKGGGNLHMLGIAPGAKILPVAIGEESASGAANTNERDIAAGIRWAADHGAKVINASVGSTGTSPDEADAVRYALSKDAVVVASAGNTAQGTREVGTPGNIPGVVTVSGVKESGDFWDGSVHGPDVVVAAPATNIVSAAPKEFAASGFTSADGSSSAAAITSGVVALIRARFPQLNAANVINRLITTAKDNGDPGRDPYFGFGTIRPTVALTADVPSVSANPLVPAASSPSASSGNANSPSHLNVGNLVIIGLIVAVPLLLIVLAVVLAVRAGRRRPPGGPPGPGPGTPGYPPHGYPPPPGYPPAAAHPPQSR